ncbi:LysR family transcriptional regulator [Protofrankia coriariae]|uniref:LysR family transcriptional regulator n=1 Tax=Protofrankia coriariae TaxID=1562887 RepID=A0ABR5F5H2_9ACTN|nr:LysR substrate-binding domain-containing protein [Protofrankia coriariae]KLL11981.1 LysR family transcriptional regulator [Protofrankia coriariae]
MELRQLEYFVAVAEEANFTRAAERVYISQSGVSAQIRQLEHELGAVLLDRSGRRCTVTAAGAAALRHARDALASVNALRQAVDDVNGLIRGRIVVGMVTACTVTPLFDALTSFHTAHPGVEITLFEDSSDRLVESVRTGVADMALVGTGSAPPKGVETLPIISDRLVAVVSNDHPLAGRPRTFLADIAAFPLVCLPTGTGIRAVFDQACSAMGIEPTIALQASAPGAITDLAARGLGVAILSESMAATRHDGVTVLPVDDILSPALLTLIWKTGKNPALRELVRHSHAAFESSPEPTQHVHVEDGRDVTHAA